jgi:hypothetical protein
VIREHPGSAPALLHALAALNALAQHRPTRRVIVANGGLRVVHTVLKEARTLGEGVAANALAVLWMIAREQLRALDDILIRVLILFNFFIYQIYY